MNRLLVRCWLSDFSIRPLLHVAFGTSAITDTNKMGLDAFLKRYNVMNSESEPFFGGIFGTGRC